MLSCSVRQILCNPIHYSPPGSSVHGMSQARILERVAFPSQGIFLAQGLNQHLLHWQAGSLPLTPPRGAPSTVHGLFHLLLLLTLRGMCYHSHFIDTEGEVQLTDPGSHNW